MGEKLDLMETFLGMRNLEEGLCHSLDLNPKLLSVFKGLLNNLVEYNCINL